MGVELAQDDRRGLAEGARSLERWAWRGLGAKAFKTLEALAKAPRGRVGNAPHRVGGVDEDRAVGEAHDGDLVAGRRVGPAPDLLVEQTI